MSRATERTNLQSGSAQENLIDDDNVVANTIIAFSALETLGDIEREWKWTLAIGILNVLTGFGCLCFPVLATETALLFLMYLFLMTGIFTAVGATCFSDHGIRHHMLWVGLLQILLGLFMLAHPFFTLTVLTIFVAFTFMMIGSFQIAIAKEHRQVAGRGLAYLSGFMSIFMSSFIILFMPMTKWYTIGVLAGVNLINIGTSRILIGCYGRSLANSEQTWMSSNDWRNLLETNW